MIYNYGISIKRLPKLRGMHNYLKKTLVSSTNAGTFLSREEKTLQLKENIAFPF